MTCSGRRYQKVGPQAEVMSVDLSQVLQALIEDRKAHERDLAEEHEQREEEQWRKEAELQVEQNRREEESKQQMVLLQKLVEGVQGNGEGDLESCSMHGMEKEARMTKLTEENDIEAYLTTFERLMEAYEVLKTWWSFKLAP